MKKLNCPLIEAQEFIKQNLKSFGGTMTQKEVGEKLNVSGPRISQIASGMRPKEENVSEGQPEQSVASEGV